MNIKMVLFDMDGTLFHNDRTISPYTAETLKKAARKGVLLGASTGRPPFFLDQVFAQYDLSSSITLYNAMNGQWIVDKNKSYDRLSYLFQGSWIASLIEKRDHSALTGTFTVYDDSDIWAETGQDYAIGMYEGMYDARHTHICPGLTCLYSETCWKLLYKNPEPLTHSLIRVLESFCEGQPYHGFQSNPNTYEFVDRHVDKAVGLKQLCQLENIPLSDTVVFGDGGNDVPALEAAGIGIAMANSVSDIREKASQVTLSNEEDGVAVWLENNILSNGMTGAENG